MDRNSARPRQRLVPSSDPPLIGHGPRATSIPRAVYCLLGAVGGLFGGLLGIGGGSAVAPLLLLFGTLKPAQVSGTTLATVLVISTVGTGAYASFGYLNLGVAWPIAIGSVIGSVLGALTSRRLSMGLMVALFLAILPYFALKEFWPSLASPEIAVDRISLGILGLGTGFLSGLLGISGASIVVPSLVAFFLIDHHAAQAIAMSVAVADSMAGTATHARAKNIDFRAFFYMAPPALVAAVAGAYLSNSLSVSVLRVIFGGFLVTVWLAMFARAIRGLARRGGTSPPRSRSRHGGARTGWFTIDPGIWSRRLRIASR